MLYLIAFAIVFLLSVVVIQIGKITDLAARIRGEEAVERANNDFQGKSLLFFMIVFLAFCVGSAWFYKNYMLGYGPLTSASAHGYELDSIFNVTLFFTGIVFVLTHIALFWYSYKYRNISGRKAVFMAHDTKLELIWTVVPAIVMTFLVAKGLIAWNSIFPSSLEEGTYLEIEATGYQFAWDIRYPGEDGKLGNKDFRLIDLASNSLGIDWNDEYAIDDIVLSGSDKIILPKDSTVKVRITSKDVLHNFYLPHFRVKMDAVPGLPTSFIFTPVKTTKEFRQDLSQYPEWQEPADPADPEGPKKWEVFEYELACAELCGKGHYSMRRIIEVVERDEYNAWIKTQEPFYLTNVRGTEMDPWEGKRLFPVEIKKRAQELKSDIEGFINDETGSVSNIVQLKHVFYAAGSKDLNSELSQYELDNLIELMQKYANVRVELSGHTDNTGDEQSNQSLSEVRANAVRQYLINKGISEGRLLAKGYGQSNPLESNDTPEGRQKNRRTELRIISK